jgi:serine/threonine protein kinase
MIIFSNPKPSNILFVRRQLKITYFGQAKAMGKTKYFHLFPSPEIIQTISPETALSFGLLES